MQTHHLHWSSEATGVMFTKPNMTGGDDKTMTTVPLMPLMPSMPLPPGMGLLQAMGMMGGPPPPGIRMSMEPPGVSSGMVQDDSQKMSQRTSQGDSRVIEEQLKEQELLEQQKRVWQSDDMGIGPKIPQALEKILQLKDIRQEQLTAAPTGENDDDTANTGMNSSRPYSDDEEKNALSKKDLVARPDVVEMHDVTAHEPKLLVHLKATRNTVPVPRHWCFKRKCLQGKRVIEKPPFELPEFIKRTGIQEMREALQEKVNHSLTMYPISICIYVFCNKMLKNH
ncbi:splicing factor 3B subunit 2 [Silurus asotus]|uniref:Splicing factor 3B subunit 2 n=1 Tax=Silurus asotus TaxID=30991 RepID=A0AAD5A4Z0_SILAS|nr:splicing factor 3B subunit 2 [Silurus asotus]